MRGVGEEVYESGRWAWVRGGVEKVREEDEATEETSRLRVGRRTRTGFVPRLEPRIDHRRGNSLMPLVRAHRATVLRGARRPRPRRILIAVSLMHEHAGSEGGRGSHVGSEAVVEDVLEAATVGWR